MAWFIIGFYNADARKVNSLQRIEKFNSAPGKLGSLASRSRGFLVSVLAQRLKIPGGSYVLHAVIMAGGSGTRFWPASRNGFPKQLLHLVGNNTMLQATFERMQGLVSPEHTLVMTNQHLVDAVRLQLPLIPPEQIVGEPMKRDTAACIALAASLIIHADPDAIMLVLPADHVISTDQQFQDCMSAGVRLIEQSPDRIVTFGIRPNYPAESFGYVQRANRWRTPKLPALIALHRFAKSQIAKSQSSICRPAPTTGTAASSCGEPAPFWRRFAITSPT